MLLRGKLGRRLIEERRAAIAEVAAHPTDREVTRGRRENLATTLARQVEIVVRIPDRRGHQTETVAAPTGPAEASLADHDAIVHEPVVPPDRRLD